jgi:hypothetical protein
MVEFVSTGIVVVISLQIIQLLTHFTDKLSSSECTGKNRKVAINMTGNREVKEVHYLHSSEADSSD